MVGKRNKRKVSWVIFRGCTGWIKFCLRFSSLLIKKSSYLSECGRVKENTKRVIKGIDHASKMQLKLRGVQIPLLQRGIRWEAAEQILFWKQRSVISIWILNKEHGIEKKQLRSSLYDCSYRWHQSFSHLLFLIVLKSKDRKEGK